MSSGGPHTGTRHQLAGLLLLFSALVLIWVNANALLCSWRAGSEIEHDPNCPDPELVISESTPHVSCKSCDGQFVFAGTYDQLEENEIYYRFLWAGGLITIVVIPLLLIGGFVLLTLRVR